MRSNSPTRTLIMHLFESINFLLVLALLILPTAQELGKECLCGTTLYGAPDIEDCKDLLSEFADPDDKTIRVFNDEQLKADSSGSWPGLERYVKSSHTGKAVQLPRTYSRGAWDGRTNILSYSSESH